jgi:uncharacterized membrane protein YgcG
MRIARLVLAAFAALWTVLLWPVLWGPRDAVAGGGEGWIINSFSSSISISPDSTLSVVEDIQVDFGSLQKHGIFRTIPLRYRYDDTRDRYYELSVQSVTNGTTPLRHDDYVESDNQVIKIGDPNTTVSGRQRYVISYAVRGAMNSFAEHDELFWNVDGALWPVPKRQVAATVDLPSAAVQDSACFQGTPGSNQVCQHAHGTDSATFASTRQLASGEEMSIVVAINKGAIAIPPPLLEPRQRRFPQDAFDITPLTVGLFFLVLVAGVGLVAWNWWRHGRDRAYLTQYYLTNDPSERAEPLLNRDPVVVEFEVPNQKRPAELGTILDEVADPKDVTATIVDMAVRGHLTIAEIPGKKDWLLTWKGSPASDLRPYEKTIIDGLFTGRQQVALSTLKGTFAPTLKKAEGQLYSELVTEKLFSSRPDHARAGWGCLGLAVVLIGFAVTAILGLAFGWGLVGLAVVIAGIVLTATFPFMPQRTASGRQLLQRTLGFRLYMTTAEKYRQQFAERAQIFTQLLPYAIVFGCVTQWAKAFEGIDTSATNNWYVGNTPFQAALLASSLQAMNTNISSAITFVPPSAGSSSGFGGGGFSGGGGGGGGGGSW